MIQVLRTAHDVHGVYADLDGGTARATDWGHAAVRVEAQVGGLPEVLLLPALSLGNTGAASGAVAICAAARSFVRNYAPGDNILLCSSSETGEVGAALISRSA